jgi:hypothetical protein
MEHVTIRDVNRLAIHARSADDAMKQAALFKMMKTILLN